MNAIVFYLFLHIFKSKSWIYSVWVEDVFDLNSRQIPGPARFHLLWIEFLLLICWVSWSGIQISLQRLYSISTGLQLLSNRPQVACVVSPLCHKDILIPQTILKTWHYGLDTWSVPTLLLLLYSTSIQSYLQNKTLFTTEGKAGPLTSTHNLFAES